MAINEYRARPNAPPALTGTVLAVDEAPRLVESYKRMLGDDYVVHTATSSSEAIDRLTPEVDIVLADRSMVDDLLTAVSVEDRWMAVVTTINLDGYRLESAFDDYLVRPVTEPELRALVESLFIRSAYERTVGQLLSVTMALVALESRVDERDLADHDRYQRLRERRRRLDECSRRQLDAFMSRRPPEVLFRNLFRSS